MKALVAGAAALMAAPMLTLGLLASTFASSSSLGPDCPATVTPTPAGAVSEAADSIGFCGEVGDQGPATAFHGPDGYVDDPTSSGRITRRMLHTYNEVRRVFIGWPWGISCWDPHLWNPTSDHPRGRACDFTVGHIGRFPTTAQRAVGWQLAHWAQANAIDLGISYIIWDGRLWSTTRADEGWRRYSGAGIYDPRTPTGGHYDHIHLSVAQKQMVASDDEFGAQRPRRSRLRVRSVTRSDAPLWSVGKGHGR